MKSAAASDISAFKRTYLLGVATRGALVVAALFGAVAATFRLGGGQSTMLGTGLMLAALAAYIVLTWRSMRVSRDAMAVADFIARGEVAEAEKLLRSTLRRFSLFPAHRVVELHQLAELRQGQGRHAEAAELAGAVIAAMAQGTGRRAAVARGLRVASSLIRLECLLELDDHRGAYALLVELGRQPMSQHDRVRLLASQTRYEVAICAWTHALHDLPGKLAMVEQMPPEPYTATHALLAVAARHLGREELGRWLLARSVAVAGAEAVARVMPSMTDWIEVP